MERHILFLTKTTQNKDVALPKLIYKLNEILIKTFTSYFMELDKLTLKFILKANIKQIARKTKGD